jgi:hypothetical protein
LGGAGYTREWPVEQCLRDARVLTIFEGTTGMQAQDLLLRRLLKGGESYRAFVDIAREESAYLPALAALEATAQRLSSPALSRRDLEAAASPFLRLATLAAQGWVAARLVRIADDTPEGRHLSAAGSYFLSDLASRAEFAAKQVVPDASRLAAFGDLL